MRLVHISSIKAGDTVEHEGQLRTVCAADINRSEFMGYTLFGDSYKLGSQLVQRAELADLSMNERLRRAGINTIRADRVRLEYKGDVVDRPRNVDLVPAMCLAIFGVEI